MTTPDAHGQAALMLCESLAYLLIEKGVLGREEVVYAIEGAIEVTREMTGREEEAGSGCVAIGLLTAIALSLQVADKATIGQQC